MEEAKAIYKRLLLSSEAVHSEDALIIRHTLSRLVAIYLHCNEVNDARIFQERLLQGLQQRLGYANYQTLMAMHDLANILHFSGKRTEAVALVSYWDDLLIPGTDQSDSESDQLPTLLQKFIKDKLSERNETYDQQKSRVMRLEDQDESWLDKVEFILRRQDQLNKKGTK